jgi:hypothetical protein
MRSHLFSVFRTATFSPALNVKRLLRDLEGPDRTVTPLPPTVIALAAALVDLVPPLGKLADRFSEAVDVGRLWAGSGAGAIMAWGSAVASADAGLCSGTAAGTVLARMAKVFTIWI